MTALSVITLVLVCLCAYAGCFAGAYTDRPILSVERAFYLPGIFFGIGFLTHLIFGAHNSHSPGESITLFAVTPVAMAIGGLICGCVLLRRLRPEDYRSK